MKVRELMTSPAYTCRPQDSLESAARLLWDHDCGMLPVVDGQGRVGAAITDRDICMAAFTRGKRLAELRVTDSMSRDVATCRPDEDVATAVERMAARQVRRLPVVDENGKPCGVLSLNDIAMAGERDARLSRDALKVLAAASRPRSSVPEVPVALTDATARRAGEPTRATARSLSAEARP